MSTVQTEGMIVHKLHPLIVLIFHVCLSFCLSTAEAEGNLVPPLLCFHSSHRLATVWLQHRGHQRTRAGVCVCGCVCMFAAQLDAFL